MAATTWTSIGTGWVAPTGWTSRCWRTRRSFVWRSAGISPISSRNTTPPSAARKMPIAFPSAPVKAPFSWPNSWLSASVADRAPQLTGTNGLVARGPLRWRRRARISLPQPVSPRIRTVQPTSAARSIDRATRAIAGLRPSTHSGRWSSSPPSDFPSRGEPDFPAALFLAMGAATPFPEAIVIGAAVDAPTPSPRSMGAFVCGGLSSMRMHHRGESGSPTPSHETLPLP